MPELQFKKIGNADFFNEKSSNPNVTPELTGDSQLHSSDQNLTDDHYTVNPSDFYLRATLNTMLCILMLGCALTFALVDTELSLKLIILPLILIAIAFISYSLYLTIKYYNISKSLLLVLSAENDRFQFGNIDNIIEYNKADISVINISGSSGTKGSRIFDITEIIFIDGSKIEFSGMLINPFLFASKFTNTKINHL
jgi:hypothetical protein